MDPNFILAHHGLANSLASLLSAHQFIDNQRPHAEVLTLIDKALVGLHDAKAEIVKFRETIYERRKIELQKEASDEP